MKPDPRPSFSLTGRAALLLAVVFTLAGLPALALAQVIYVDHAATGGNDGSSWTDAYTDLQDALAAAGTGTEIWVAAGVYKPTDDVDDRAASFHLKNDVALYGGFAGTETQRDQRDWAGNVTVLSGDIDDDDITDADGVTVDADDMRGGLNSYHVVVSSNIGASAILDGFVISGGLANVIDYPSFYGGGMFNGNGSPTLSNLRFSGNWGYRGGGMASIGNTPILMNVRFSGNRAEFLGGGLYNGSSSPVLTNVSFSGNRATLHGGGMANNESSSPTLTNVSFSGNRAGSHGGGMYSFSSSDPTLTNVSFSGNRADSNGGGMYNELSLPTIQNSLFWHNQDASGIGTPAASIANLDSSIPQIRYSLVQGCNPNGNWNSNCGTDAGDNREDADPLFIDTPDPAAAPTSAGNLRLRAGSPVIDAGNDALVPNTVDTDLDGNPRIVGAAVDLGPYERPPAQCPAGGVIHVSQQATEPADGTSWASAFADLQDALVVEEPCEIWVAAGVYKPTNVVADRSASFHLKNDVALYGGFVGTETQRDQRDWAENVTVLSGDIDDNDNTDADGVTVDADDIVGDNSLHVVVGSGTGGSAILDGFVISGGLANVNEFPIFYGGGMFNDNGSPTLSNVRFSGNRAHYLGGGLYNESSSPVLTNVRFSGNQAGLGGGGISNLISSNPTLTNVRFSSNRAEINGGGMFNDNSNPTLINVRFSGNRADFLGGGLYNGSSSPVLTNVRFSGNHAALAGGGMSNLFSSNPTLTNVRFSGNQADLSGGGMHSFSSSPVLTNVRFSGNSADINGGGMFNDNSNPTLTNVSFSGNRADSNGGGMYNELSLPTIQNSLFWHNQDASGIGTPAASIANLDSSIPQIRYSLVQGCNPNGNWNSNCGTDAGDNREDADPLFIDTPDPAAAPTSAGNLRLRAGSPAIDAGNDTFVDGIDDDLDGNPRLIGAAVDLGPYENDAYLLVLEVLGSGAVEAQPSPDALTEGYGLGTEVELTAIPDTGWRFVEWSGDLGGDDNPAELAITGNRSVTATFVEVYTVTAGVAAGQGSISPEAQNVDHGDTATFTVVPATGWSVDTVHGDPCNPELVAGDDWQAENITEDCTVSARFVLHQYTVTAGVAAGQGSISPASQTVDHGESASFTVVPATGWSIESISGDPCNPELVAGDGWQAENITTACAVSARFVINQYSVGGTVTGLEGTGLTLSLNGIEALQIAGNGPFTFLTELDHDSPYEVGISQQPSNPAQSCQLANATGTVAAADVNDIEVNCAIDAFVIGGTVTGLEGEGLQLRLNDGEILAITAGGAFEFLTTVPDLGSYAVSVFTQPVNPSQACGVDNGAGTVAGSDVDHVLVSCATPALSVSLDPIDFGTLPAGEEATRTLLVSNNSQAPLTITEVSAPNAPFALAGGTCLPPIMLAPGESCSIQVSFSPAAAGTQHTGSLEIVSDAPSSPNTVGLTGASVMPASPVPVNRPALLLALVLLLLLAGCWRLARPQPAGPDGRQA